MTGPGDEPDAYRQTLTMPGVDVVTAPAPPWTPPRDVVLPDLPATPDDPSSV